MSYHCFDTDIAKKYTVDVAVFLNNLNFWIIKNAANKKNFHDGACWSYNSQDALGRLFPYWTRQNIRTVIKKCKEFNLIQQGSYNKTSYDRTGWYSFTEVGIKLFPELEAAYSLNGWNQPMDWTKLTNGLDETNQPIPDTKTDTKTDIKKEIKNKEKNNISTSKNTSLISELLTVNPFGLPGSLIQDWLTVRGDKKKTVTPTAWTRLMNTLQKCREAGYDPTDCFELMVENGWYSLRLEWVENYNKDRKQTSHKQTQSRTEQQHDSSWLTPNRMESLERAYLGGRKKEVSHD
jgi:hypothetical protein